MTLSSAFPVQTGIIQRFVPTGLTGNLTRGPAHYLHVCSSKSAPAPGACVREHHDTY